MADDQQQYNDGEYGGDQQYEYGDGTYNEEQYQQDGEMADGTGDGNADGADGQDQMGEDGRQDGGDNSKGQSDEERKLFVGGISWDTEQKDLKDYFSKYGEITDVNIKTDPHTGKSRGFGFVTFATQEAVESVLKNGPHTVKGKQVDPKRAKARPGIKKIFVGGLEADLPESEIKGYFEKFGKIESIELPFDKTKNQRRQFAFITFESEDAVEEVCKQPKQKIGNKECDIKKATPKPDPRAARGGYGGWGAGGPRGGGRGRGRGRGGYGQNQNWGGQGYGGYSQGYGYNQGYGNYGNYDYGSYGNYGGYGSGYGGYDYPGWNYGQGGYGSGYGQQQSSYGKTRRGTGGQGGYHPYSR